MSELKPVLGNQKYVYPGIAVVPNTKVSPLQRVVSDPAFAIGLGLTMICNVSLSEHGPNDEVTI